MQNGQFVAYIEIIMEKFTTLRVIKSFGPCAGGWRKLTKALGTRALSTKVSYLQILESNGLVDAIWALRCDPALAVEFASKCSDSIKHLNNADAAAAYYADAAAAAKAAAAAYYADAAAADAAANAANAAAEREKQKGFYREVVA